MSTQNSEIVSSYFTAVNSADFKLASSLFAADAQVIDSGEDKNLAGRTAIQEWMEGSIAAYNLSHQILKRRESADGEKVSALVTGDFPGSPIEFDYEFVIYDGKISRLEISVSG